MRWYWLAILVLAVIVPIQQPPAFSQSEPGVVVVLFYPPYDCKTDFDQEFWANYDSAMKLEWNISSQTICLEKLSEQEKADLLAALHGIGLNVIVMQDENIIVRGLNYKAEGVAHPSLNYGEVELNYEKSTKALSHETLHLVLEDMGRLRSCYVDKVHENAYSYARYYDNVMIMAHFDC
ncbi:MAG: hypothetical protein AB1351_00725 [Thermoproteota archaeon]